METFTTDNKHQDSYSSRRIILICIILFIVTFAVYSQVIYHDFINFDDDIYVTDNFKVIKGLHTDNLPWAFSLTEKHGVPYWHPLTWVSHMLDCSLFGLNAGMHHLVNLIFHITNTLLLFYLLNLTTGAIWRSAMVAALFAIHPLNVESVAWIAERKNLLSTFFWMLTMLFYIYYTKRQNIITFTIVIISFILGLLAKPMLVTLPFVFLLFDYWPLERFSLNEFKSQKEIIFHLLLEKVPFFIISLCSVYISSVSLNLQGSIISTSHVPICLRLENSVVSCVSYIGKMIWPSYLSVFYPFPLSIPEWKVITALTLLIAVTVVFVFVMIKRFPYLTTGWLWFIGTFIPVSGLVQAGKWPAMADRWAYIPCIGLFIIISWGGYELFSRYHFKNIGTAIVSSVIIIALSVVTFIQLTHWGNSESLYKHALQVTPNNFIILNNMGTALIKDKRYSDAEVYLKKALKLKPDYSKAYFNLGTALYKQGYLKEAVKHYSEALRINPEYSEPYYNLGLLFFKQNRIEQAIKYYIKAIKLKPDYAEAHNNLGLAYYKTGITGNALKHYSEALRIHPNLAEAHKNIGNLLFNSGNFDAALSHFKRAATINPKDKNIEKVIITALKAKEKFQKKEKRLLDIIGLNPDDYICHTDLGNFYLSYKKLNLAIKQYKKALTINPDDHLIIIKLAKIYAMKGNYNKAISEAKRAIALKPDYAYGYYFIASIYSLLNDKEKSIEWLKKSVDKGYNDWSYLRSDKNLYNIRSTSYYMELAKKK
ncbi:MAG: tetratricopeptide repeat protein [Pseudomonadota bacterium]